MAGAGQAVRLGAAAAASRICARWATPRPAGPILGARVEHLSAKEALLADDPDVYFTTPHFDGYAAVLVRLDRIALDELEELIVEAWLVPGAEAPGQEYAELHWLRADAANRATRTSVYGRVARAYAQSLNDWPSAASADGVASLTTPGERKISVGSPWAIVWVPPPSV